MNKFNPYKVPLQLWTDIDLAKWAGFAFVAGIILGALLTWH